MVTKKAYRDVLSTRNIDYHNVQIPIIFGILTFIKNYNVSANTINFKAAL